MTDAVDELYDVIEKANSKGLIRGGSSSKLRGKIERYAASERGKLRGDAKAGRSNRFTSASGAAKYLGTRKEYGRVASRFKGYVEARQSKNYK